MLRPKHAIPVIANKEFVPKRLGVPSKHRGVPRNNDHRIGEQTRPQASAAEEHLSTSGPRKDDCRHDGDQRSERALGEDGKARADEVPEDPLIFFLGLADR